MAALLTDEEVLRYRRDGFVVTSLFLPEALLAAAEKAIARARIGDFDHQIDPQMAIFDRTVSPTEPVEQYGYLALRTNAFRALLQQSRIGEAAACLVETDHIRLFHDRFIAKHPNGSGSHERTIIGWHTDKGYWRTASSSSLLTAWVPFQSCSGAMGSLAVMRGSHHWSGNDWMATAHETDMDALEAQVSSDGQPLQRVDYEMKRGQIAFHHCLTVHGSGPNLTNTTRASWSVHLQDGDNRYQEVVKADGRRHAHLNDFLCRRDAAGAPDYADQLAFPTLWRAA